MPRLPTSCRAEPDGDVGGPGNRGARRCAPAVLFGGHAGGFDSERMLHWLNRGGGAEPWAEWRKDSFNLVAFPCSTARLFDNHWQLMYI